jgi:ribose transport system substrate-binding protein
MVTQTMRKPLVTEYTNLNLFWMLSFLSIGLVGCGDEKRLGSRDPHVLAAETATDSTSSVKGVLTGERENGSVTRIVVSALSTREPMTYTRALTLQKFARLRSGLSFVFLDAQGDIQNQAAQLKSSLALNPRFILLFAEGATELHEVIQEAQKQGVKIISLGRDLSGEQVMTSIFTDERKVGSIAGKYIVEALKKKALDEGKSEAVGRVVEISGDSGGRVSKERSEGFANALSQTPGIRIVHEAPGNWNEKDTQARIAEAARLQKPFDIVFAHSDIMAHAAHLALKAQSSEQRDQILIMGIDGFLGNTGGVQMVVKSELDVTVFNPPLVDLAWKLINKVLDDPTFVPSKRYELEPSIINLEKALEVSAKGFPSPSL